MTALRVAVAAVLVAVAYFVFARRQPGTSRALPRAVVTRMNWLRGLAAVAVLLGHVRGLYLQDYESVRRPSIAWKAFYAVSGLGHQAVVVFFILSGFLIGSTVLAQNADQRWGWRDYASRRLARLYVVLLPGLLLTAAWDAAGLSLFGADGLYGGHLAARYLSMPDVRVTLSLGHFFGNLFFLQHLFIAPFGTNGPLWSLSYEFWAYLLFPLLVRAGTASEKSGRRLLFLVLAFAVLGAGGLKLDLYFTVWMLGAVLALWWRQARTASSSTGLKAVAWLGFAACVMLGRSSKLNDALADPILGVATAFLLAVLLRVEPASAQTKPQSEGAAAWLANFSYTLYVAHYPVIAFFFVAFMGGQRRIPSVGSVLLVLSICAAVVFGYAFPLSRLTEAHTDALRRRLSKR